MNKLLELQSKCVDVTLHWNNGWWSIECRLPNGVGCLHESHSVKAVIAEAYGTIVELQRRGTKPLGAVGQP